MNINFNQIISTKEAKYWLDSSVDQDVDEIIICSAYIKLNSLEYFYNNFINNKFDGKCKFLARWLASDLIQGASDLECYSFLSERNIPFYIKNDFHGKIYYVSQKGLLMGSPNFTSSGLGLNLKYNDETGVILEESIKNYEYINNIFTNSCLVDFELYKKIKEHINKFPKQINKPIVAWDEQIIQIMQNKKNDEYFSIDEWFFAEGLNEKNSDSLNHDLSLMGIHGNQNQIDVIKKAFVLTKPYQWLKSSLKDNNFKLNFGGLSERLHNKIKNIPPPLRRDVKLLLRNLLSWINDLEIDEITIKQPNISQIICLNVE